MLKLYPHHRDMEFTDDARAYLMEKVIAGEYELIVKPYGETMTELPKNYVGWTVLNGEINMIVKAKK